MPGLYLQDVGGANNIGHITREVFSEKTYMCFFSKLCYTPLFLNGTKVGLMFIA